ncbi:MAG: MarR family transcriptional regulator [Clostridia bacterium]|nr:MarR family transcriptional regulator [Clostridia bacterium]
MKEERFIRFALLIGGVQKHLQKIKLVNASELGIKSVHTFWLYQLLSCPEGMTASELAVQSMIDRSLISREITELEKNGYVSVEPSDGKRSYNSKIRLTEKGTKMAEYVGRLALQFQNEIDCGISLEDLQSFYATLEKLYANFARIAKEGWHPTLSESPDTL